ncbi:helix-turn-helix transcriptional regulator [Streptomyces sp. NPDC007369]|uniref:helix-turn-helix transcriptional regulator n=1 Tax=Streptomyces sp. NPDC007369 TaxID=3154589 RepID=UPI0033C09FFF
MHTAYETAYEALPAPDRPGGPDPAAPDRPGVRTERVDADRAGSAAPPGVREVTLWTPLSGTAVVTGAAPGPQGGAVRPLPAGALVTTDSAVPALRIGLGPDGGALAALRVPRTLLPQPDAVLSAAAGRVRDAGSGVGALLVPLVLGAAAAPPHPGRGRNPCPYRKDSADRLAGQLAGQLADLLGALLQELAAGPDATVADRELLDRIRWYVNGRLGDPGLCPEAIAAAHSVSVRRLHKLFAREGTTLGRWIQQRRLQECRRELGRTDGAPVKVAAVAQRWGFRNAAHFSRAFRVAYGVPPRDWRRARTRYGHALSPL